MDFRSLEIFVWVAALGSFRRAAARLNTTQPAVSQRIAQLEAELGVRLLERTRRAVALTDRGRVLLAGAQDLLAQSAALRERVADPDRTRGTLRLGTAETVVHTWLPRFLERVSRAYPRLAIEVEVDITPMLADRLAAREIDLAFLLGPCSGAGIRNLPLGRFPMAFLAAPSLPLPDRPLDLPDLARVPLVTFARRTRPYADLIALVAGLSPRPRIHASASLATVLRMAADGLGLAAVPEATAREELAQRRLRAVAVEEAARLPDLVFTASWPAGPTPFLAEAVAGLAAEVAAEAG